MGLTIVLDGKELSGTITSFIASDTDCEFKNASFIENVEIGGNLNVNGSTTTIRTVNTVIKDKLIGLNASSADSSASYSGLIIENAISGSNVFIGLDNSNNFVAGKTNASASAETINDLAYIDFVGNNASFTSITGNLTGNSSGVHTGDVAGNLTGNSSGGHTGAVTGNLTGNCSGVHTGDVTGNLTGNCSGVHTGDVTGNLTGNSSGVHTGDVTGNLTGNCSGVHTGHVAITGGTITGIADLAVADGGTGLSDIAKGSVLVANSINTLISLDGGDSGESGDTVLFYTSASDTISWNTLANVCFLKGTKITLPDRSQKNIEDLTLADDVLTYKIDMISNIKDKNVLKNVQLDSMKGRFSTSGIRNIWMNPTDSYLIINDKLRVTKKHIIHFKRDNEHYFKNAEGLNIGDELLNDKEVYESIESIEEIHGKTNVYNFELDQDNTYFAENYLVHHYCELCSGYANII